MGQSPTSAAGRSATGRRRIARFLPFLEWGRTYNHNVLTSDLLAAVIVTVMLIPQSLAYALLAGLPPEVGLYASILPLLGYPQTATMAGQSATPDSC